MINEDARPKMAVYEHGAKSCSDSISQPSPRMRETTTYSNKSIIFPISQLSL